MKAVLNWNNLRLFLAVARAGGLAAAARQTGTSVPTLSRKMAAFEEQTGRVLFVRGARGYELTDDGRALVDLTVEMNENAEAINRWLGGPVGIAPKVRISAGTWTARLLADNIDAIWTASDDWVPEFQAGNARVDVARRSADIGIRNREPEEPWLAGKQIGSVTYAAYALHEWQSRTASRKRWISMAAADVITPTTRWTLDNHGAEIAMTVNSPELGLSLARQGVGAIVLPCFVGDAFRDLARLGEPIAALTSRQWLVMHQDRRHYPPVRVAIDRLAAFLLQPARRVSAF